MQNDTECTEKQMTKHIIEELEPLIISVFYLYFKSYKGVASTLSKQRIYIMHLHEVKS